MAFLNTTLLFLNVFGVNYLLFSCHYLIPMSLVTCMSENFACAKWHIKCAKFTYHLRPFMFRQERCTLATRLTNSPRHPGPVCKRALSAV